MAAAFAASAAASGSADPAWLGAVEADGPVAVAAGTGPCAEPAGVAAVGNGNNAEPARVAEVTEATDMDIMVLRRRKGSR